MSKLCPKNAIVVCNCCDCNYIFVVIPALYFFLSDWHFHRPYRRSLLVSFLNFEIFRINNEKKSESFITNTKKDSLKNIYQINEHKILLIDNNGIYNTSYQPSIIILSQSPKINLNRLINTLSPKLIIADNNNYKSYIARWRETCTKQKIPFHYTGEKGFLAISLKEWI